MAGRIALICLCLGGCAGPQAAPNEAISFGLPNHGHLRGGQALPASGEGYVLARPLDPTRWGTPSLVGAVRRAAADVARRWPGGAPLRVGDLASPRGGRHSRHGSHRSGRDADLIFYLLDQDGHAVPGRGWLAFDRFGVGREHRTPDGQPSGRLFYFDTARNWHLVRTLLADPHAGVQWIFCSRGIKARLLRHGALHEPDPRIVARAATVLHQPSRGRAHDDHFHVRVVCTPRELATGCADYGPVWPWLRDRFEKPPLEAVATVDDRTLLTWLFEGWQPEGAAGAAATPP